MASIAANNAFGIVTVMDVKVLSLKTELDGKTIEDIYKDHSMTRAEFHTALKNYLDGSPAYLCEIDHLQVANLTTDGPSIEISGGKFNNKLIKYGKTARCEMTDALGQMDALVALGGAQYLNEQNPSEGIVVTDKFGAPVLMVGSSFVVDQKTGKHVSATVILYQFLPDSTPAFAFDSGNAATFDLNGDLLAVEFERPEGETGCEDASGSFFALELDSCELAPQPGEWANVVYGNGATGPNKMQIGVEYPLAESGVDKHYVAKNLSNMSDISSSVVDGDTITLTTGISNVLITLENNE